MAFRFELTAPGASDELAPPCGGEDTPAAEPVVRRASPDEVLEHVLGFLQIGALVSANRDGKGMVEGQDGRVFGHVRV